jgi:hypothetical protein
MHTGQNSIAPENSLPQLGQVRLGSVLMALPAVQPQPELKATPRSTERCEIGQHGSLANCCPVPQAIGCSFILARHIMFRNKIPTVGILRRPVLITTFGDRARLEIKRRKPCGWTLALSGNGERPLLLWNRGHPRRGSLREIRISPAVTLETPDEPTRHQSLRPITSPNGF